MTVPPRGPLDRSRPADQPRHDTAAWNTMRRLGDACVIAVIRAQRPEDALRAVDAVVGGGIAAVEITYSTPDVPSVLRRLATSYGDDIVLGAGTVTHPGEVDAAVSAGARFLVSPGLDDDVAAAMAATGSATLMGAFTPTEVIRARAVGAHAVKLFPASTGGVGHLRALRGPFPELRFVPTGGVSAGNVREWLDAGVFAVGAAGSLCPPKAIADGDFEEIRRRAVAFDIAVQEYRAGSPPGRADGDSNRD
jgi:2-dehydro-3-deoxyphosphogluconate aldolase/(4S)-4-hydroxy-2-oxoglutarate aldolase